MLRWSWLCIVLVVSTAVLGTAAAVATLVRPGCNATMRLGKVWSRWLLAAAGVRPEYHGLDHARRHVPCLYMANHQSFVDIWVTAPVLPDVTRFLAKQSLFRIPVFGWSMSIAGFVPIDRSNRRKALASLRRAAGVVRAGHPLILFPEGTRSRDGQLGPFKKGAFYMALQVGAPIVPVAISGSWKVLPRGGFRVCPGKVRVEFAPPVDPRPFAASGDLASLSAKVRRIIEERLAASDAVECRAAPSPR